LDSFRQRSSPVLAAERGRATPTRPARHPRRVAE
jgi:hypothetical protein